MRRSRAFRHEPRSVRAARHFAGRVVRNALPDTVEVVGLVVCELARSWIRHTGGGFELAIIRDGREIRVEATDQAGGIPAMCSPKPTDPSGRAAQDRRYAGGGGWGVRTGVAAGKTVWFTVPVTALAGAGCWA